MQNIEIKRAARGAMIPMWRIAERIGVSEMTLIRWLRVELTDEKRQCITDAIEQLKQEAE